MFTPLARATLVAAALLACGTPYAQQAPGANPSVESMIQQLEKPRTRSLRNLTVERPSLSLQVQFDFDSARIRPDSEELLDNLAKALKSPELSSSKFAVEGHTDAKGRPDYNQRLSQRRADAVRDLLVRKGIEAVRLQTAGKGSTEPANPADPLAAENRRVRVVNLD